MEDLRSEADKKKAGFQGKMTVLDNKCHLKDTELKLLEDELDLRKQSASEQDAEVYLCRYQACRYMLWCNNTQSQTYAEVSV